MSSIMGMVDYLDIVYACEPFLDALEHGVQLAWLVGGIKGHTLLMQFVSGTSDGWIAEMTSIAGGRTHHDHPALHR